MDDLEQTFNKMKDQEHEFDDVEYATVMVDFNKTIDSALGVLARFGAISTTDYVTMY
jgi:hypothetical protein